MATKVYAIAIGKDDTVAVVSAEVVRETPQYYFREQFADGWRDPRYYAFGYSNRIIKERAFTTARACVQHYMEKRQRDKANALAVAGQAKKQIASANELLMHLPDESPSPESSDR